MKSGVHISVVSPVYRAEKMLDELVSRIAAALSEITDSYEIVLVDDRSPDGSWEKLKEIARKNNRVKAIRLSRNFGQHYAITAGLDATLGDWVVVMDCDLQDRPEEIVNLYRKVMEGYELVMGQRFLRQDSLLKTLMSRLFYWIFNYLTEMRSDNSVANFGIYSRKVVNALLSLRETGRSFSLLVRWVGFSGCYLTVQHDERRSGGSSYTWAKLIRLASDSMIAFSEKPLRLCINLGLIITLISVFISVITALKYFKHGISVPGYTSIILSLWFLGGMIIFVLGVVGLYISKILDNVKKRPLYIVDQRINL